MKERKGPGCFFGALELFAIFVAFANVMSGDATMEDYIIAFFVGTVVLISVVYVIYREINVQKRLRELRAERKKQEG